MKRTTMHTHLKSQPTFLCSRSERGQDLAEYAMLLGLIALVVIAVIILVGGQILALFDYIVTNWPP